MIPSTVRNRVSLAAVARVGLQAVLAAAVWALAVSSGAQAPPRPLPAAHTAAECSDLVKQYDEAAPAHHGATRAQDAARARDAGAAACQAGRYAEGISALRRALHDIGVNPVRYVPPAHP